VTAANEDSVRRGMLQVAFAATLWGTWSLFLRPAALPATVTAPLVIGLVGLLVAPAARREPATEMTSATWRLLALSAALEALNVVTFFGAMSVTSNAVAVLTHYFAPVLVALFAPWIDKQRVPGARIAALLAITGLALVLRPWNAHPDRNMLVGAALGTISAFGYAGNVFVLRRLVHAMGPARAQFVRCIAAALLLAPGVLLGPKPVLTVAAVGLVSIGAVIPGAFAGLLFARGLPLAGAARASVLTYLEPLVSVLIGATVWREGASLWTAAGSALLIAGGLIVSRGESAPK
jgi:drug/metabolite transporter, DME family